MRHDKHRHYPWLFKKFVLSNFPYIEEDFDALTNYQLRAQLIAFVRRMGIQVADLTTLVKEFQEYFATLDVQDEVDNKINEMAESGELVEIISEYLNAKVTLTFANVAEMKAADNLIDGSLVETYGFYSKGDGGGAKYIITGVTTDDDIDEMFTLSLLDNTLVAKLVIEPILKIKQLGSKDDNDSSEILQAAINSGHKYILINEDIIVNNTITVANEVTLDLDNNRIIASVLPADDYLFEISTRYNGKLNLINGTITGTDENNFIKNTVEGTTWGYSFNLNKLIVEKFNEVINGHNLYNCMITNCIFRGDAAHFVFNADTMTNQNTFRNCYFKGYESGVPSLYPDYKIDITKGRNWLFEQCSFEQMKTTFKVTSCSRITVKSCEFEQQDYVANTDEGMDVDGSNFIVMLSKKYENYSFNEEDKTGILFTNIVTDDSADSNIRHSIRHSGRGFGNTTYGLTSSKSGWVPIYDISGKSVNVYQPVNTIQARSEGAVSSQTIALGNFNRGSNRDFYKITMYTSVEGVSSGGARRLWKTEMYHENGISMIIAEPTVAVANDWNGSASARTTLAITYSDGVITITPSESVQLRTYVKIEYMGDNIR